MKKSRTLLTPCLRQMQNFSNYPAQMITPIPFEPNQVSLEMANRLEPIKALLAMLHKPLSKHTSEYVTVLLSNAIEVRHYKRKLNHHNSNPTVLPSSIRFKFKLSYKSEYEDTTQFKTQATKSAEIMHNCKQVLRVCMIDVIEIELHGAIKNNNNHLLMDYWNYSAIGYAISKHATQITAPHSVMTKELKAYFKCFSKELRRRSLNISTQIKFHF